MGRAIGVAGFEFAKDIRIRLVAPLSTRPTTRTVAIELINVTPLTVRLGAIITSVIGIRIPIIALLARLLDAITTTIGNDFLDASLLRITHTGLT